MLACVCVTSAAACGDPAHLRAAMRGSPSFHHLYNACAAAADMLVQLDKAKLTGEGSVKAEVLKDVSAHHACYFVCSSRVPPCLV